MNDYGVVVYSVSSCLVSLSAKTLCVCEDQMDPTLVMEEKQVTEINPSDKYSPIHFKFNNTL